METFILENDITVVYIQASSFPDGVLAAHEKLHSLISFTTDRRYFGISSPDKTGGIVYKAAAEEINEGEAQQLQLSTFIIKKGMYISLILADYKQDITGIGKSFDQLLTNPAIDPQGACIEWYINDNDMRCMVRLKS